VLGECYLRPNARGAAADRDAGRIGTPFKIAWPGAARATVATEAATVAGAAVAENRVAASTNAARSRRRLLKRAKPRSVMSAPPPSMASAAIMPWPTASGDFTRAAESGL